MSSTAASTATSGHTVFPGSRRVYLPGSRPDLRVPMREITLTPTRLSDGTEVPNDPVRVYDTAGAWGDPAFHGDSTKGVPALRAAWIAERGDTEPIAGRTVLPQIGRAHV